MQILCSSSFINSCFPGIVQCIEKKPGFIFYYIVFAEIFIFCVFQIFRESILLSDDVFNSKFRDPVLGDRVEPGKEDMEVVIDQGGNVPLADKNFQSIKLFMLFR